MTANIVVIPARRGHSNHAEVARTIAIGIIKGHYAEGAKLPGEPELLVLFGVSRPVLRESVKTLVAKGLLSTKARVGTVVRERAMWNMFDPDVMAWHLDAGIDKRFLRDLADIRLAVEPRAAALAAERRSEADLAQMQAAIRQMHLAVKGEGAGFADADLRLHLLIAKASGNQFMRSIGAVIEAALRASFVLSEPVDDRDYQITVAAHERIVECIADRDSEAASAAMTNVIFNGLRRHGAVG